MSHHISSLRCNLILVDEGVRSRGKEGFSRRKADFRPWRKPWGKGTCFSLLRCHCHCRYRYIKIYENGRTAPLNILATNPVFFPPPRSRITVFFPQFFVRTGANWDLLWPKCFFSFPKVAKRLELGRNQEKMIINLGNVGKKNLKMKMVMGLSQ